MNKTNKVNEVALRRAMRTMGFKNEYEAANYMWGYYRGLLNHLERSVPGVAQELAVESYRLMEGGVQNG